MRTLNLGEVQKARELSSTDNIRRCGSAYAVATTYVPALCDMAEEYLKTRALANVRQTRVKYSIEGDSVGGWIIKGSDGFSVTIGKGDSVRLVCSKIAERLNGVI